MLQQPLHRLKGNSALPYANQSPLSGLSSDALSGPQAIKPVLANQHHPEAAYSPPVAKLRRQQKWRSVMKCLGILFIQYCNLVITDGFCFQYPMISLSFLLEPWCLAWIELLRHRAFSTSGGQPAHACKKRKLTVIERNRNRRNNRNNIINETTSSSTT